MTIEELNQRYGAPGRIVFHRGFAGYPEAVLANKYGVAEIALLGANTLAYRPTGHSPVLFRPAKRDHNRGESFHGGVPVCFPQFGRKALPEMPQHGFARLCVWKVRATQYSEEQTELTLVLTADEQTRRLWPYAFELELKLSLSMKLNLKLTVKNTDNQAFAFGAGFHPYLLVRERDGVTVRGLEGCEATEVVGDNQYVQVGELKLNTAINRIFALPPTPRHEFAVLDEGLHRAVAMASTGHAAAVVWNPGSEQRLADLEPEEWRRFVCVEPVVKVPGEQLVLKPGESHSLLMAIQSVVETAASSVS